MWSQALRQRNAIETRSLADLTTFRIGGPAQVLTLEDPMDLPEVIACERKHFLGKGANLLVCDDELQQPVVRLGQTFRSVERLQESSDEVLLRVGAAHDLALLIGRCCREGLGGLEGLAGVPATIGGALAMNAGTASHWLMLSSGCRCCCPVPAVRNGLPAPVRTRLPQLRFSRRNIFCACELRLRGRPRRAAGLGQTGQSEKSVFPTLKRCLQPVACLKIHGRICRRESSFRTWGSKANASARRKYRRYTVILL